MVVVNANMPVEELAALLRGPRVAMPPGWEKWPVTHQAHRLLLEEALAAITAYPGGHEGRGIVSGAGGAKYFACAMTAIACARHHGCKLPVEFWHLGASEFDPQMKRVAENHGIRCMDAFEVAKRFPVRWLSGWELKPYAVLHSRFREVMYLDADNVPMRDPTYLLDDPRYKRHGAAFWPDIPPQPVNWGNRQKEWLPAVCWANFGLEYRNEPAFESGQFIVDKSRCWRPLNLAMHVNQHSDWYYQFLFGDKDTFHLSWRKCGQDYAMPQRGPVGGFPGLRHFDFDGKPVFQHCTQCKEALAERRPIRGFAWNDLAIARGNELHREWSGCIWTWIDQTKEETALARQQIGRWKYTRFLGGRGQARPLTLADGGNITEGRAGCELRWTLRVLDGVPTLVIVGTAHKNQEIGMMLLTQDGEKRWVGRWEAHERCPVEMERLP